MNKLFKSILQLMGGKTSDQKTIKTAVDQVSTLPQESNESNQEGSHLKESVAPNSFPEESEEVSNKNRIYNLIIVDESGSMGELRDATISGINELIGTIKQAQNDYNETQQHYLSLVTFDSPGQNNQPIRTIIDKRPIQEIVTFGSYVPRGCTPLFDAMGQSLVNMKNFVGNDVNSAVVVTILTDGLENASKEWTSIRLKKLIEQLKEMGWTFSYMGSAHNVKEVTDLLSIENSVEFSHDMTGASHTWERERSSRRAYYDRMHSFYSCMSDVNEEEIIRRKKVLAQHYYGDRVTPNNITELNPDQIFVFGSNAAGMHAGGAAALANLKFGAIWGQGEGLQGQSYAIPTMEGLTCLEESVKRFTRFAEENPDSIFLVTRIGCGIAGYSPSDIAPLFKDCIKLENVSLPEDFWDILGLRMTL